MAGTIKIFGTQVPKTAAIAGGGIVLIGGIYFYRKQKASSANAASVAAAGASSIDPATGYAYGSAEDSAALAAQGNYQSPGGSTGYGYGGYAGGSGGSFGGSPGTFSSNAAWAQYVEAYMVNNEGADAPTVGNAIGKYITGQPLTDSGWVSIVDTAIAIGGYPPVSGPNGNPPGFITSNTTPTPTPEGTVSVPNCVGQTAGAAHNQLVNAGLIPTANAGQRAEWRCTGTNPSAGTQVTKGSKVQIIANAPSTTKPPPKNGGSKPKTYTVKSGDNLTSIGAKYGMSWQTLYNANKAVVGNNPNLIHPGEVLTIP